MEATALVNELGRRTPATIGFVEPDDEGDIVIPVATGAGGEVQEARYKSVTRPFAVSCMYGRTTILRTPATR